MNARPSAYAAHASGERAQSTCGGGPNLRTLPDIARCMRAMAEELAADEFMLCLRAGDGQAMPFTCVMDAAYPASSAPAARFVAGLPGWLATVAGASPAPLWWEGSEGRAPTGVEASPWAARVDLPSPTGGLALPLTTERGRQGLLVFRGETMKVAAERLPGLHAACYAHFATVANTTPREEKPAPSISKRELECLKLTASGHTSEEIGRLLGLSVHTANQYLANTTQKLNAVNRVHAVAKALREGLID